MGNMNLWDLANTVVNYEVDKYLKDLNYCFIEDSFVKNITLHINRKTYCVVIETGLNFMDNYDKHSNFIRIVTRDFKTRESIVYFDKSISLHDFKNIGEKLIEKFITEYK